MHLVIIVDLLASLLRKTIHDIADSVYDLRNMLLQRQQGATCRDRCKKNCKNGKIRVKPTCRCECPPGTKKDGKTCTPGDDKDCPEGKEKDKDGKCIDKPKEESETCPPSQEKKDGKCQDKPKNQDKESKFQELKKKKQIEYDDEEKKEDEQKEKEKKNEEEEERKNKEKRIKRMGKCVPLVGLTFAADQAYEFSSEYFSEDVLISDEMDEFWPTDIPLDDEIDKKLDSDEFLDDWGNTMTQPEWPYMGISPEPIWIPRRSLDPVEDIETEKQSSADETDPRPQHEKRFWFAIIAFCARIGATVAGQGVRLSRIAIDGFKVARAGAARFLKPEQLKAIRNDIAKSTAWKDCLKAVVPKK